jgi:hypothetical protein
MVNSEAGEVWEVGLEELRNPGSRVDRRVPDIAEAEAERTGPTTLLPRDTRGVKLYKKGIQSGASLENGEEMGMIDLRDGPAGMPSPKTQVVDHWPLQWYTESILWSDSNGLRCPEVKSLEVLQFEQRRKVDLPIGLIQVFSRSVYLFLPKHEI